MSTRRIAAVAAASAFAAIALVTSPARSTPLVPTVTLRSSEARLTYGGATRLAGRVSPPPGAGDLVEIVADGGSVVARTRTDAEGRYRVRYEPRRTIELTARWRAVLSDPVTVRVRPIVTAHVGAAHLFGRSRVFGRVQPAHDGARVKVRLMRNGRALASRSVRLDGRRFSTRFTIPRPGTYRAVVSFDDADHLAARARSGGRTPRLPSLSRGDSGIYVRLLERRLRRLDYHLFGARDGAYDHRTADAVRAFNKVQGRRRLGTVNEATWRALASPRRPRPRASTPRFHFEVDQTKQVLYTVEDGEVTNILHVSTGADGATRDGVFHVHRKLAGYSAGGLYYPSYFDGLRAFHGWQEVPTYPASHGCVRLPMWTAKWVYARADIGAEVRIYH